MNDTTWIVIANASRARVFLQEKPDRLVELDDLVNPKPNAGQPNQLPDGHQTELFARDLAGLLLTGLQEGRYRRLMLSASPKFLGVLRQVMDPRVQAAVGLEINQDYTQCSVYELPGKLAVPTAKPRRAD